MKALTYQIHLLEPVLATQLGGGDPNSAVSFDFIPGSIIRGALIGKYLKNKGKKIDAEDVDFQHLFLNGSVRFLNAYPLTEFDRKRALPTPISWHKKKDEVDIKCIYDFSIKEGGDSELWNGVGNFCRIFNGEDGKYVELYKTKVDINMHTFRDDRQKTTAEKSTIFRYQPIESGQEFSGVILADDHDDLENISSLISNDTILNLAKSHLAEYGSVRIENVISNEWKEYEPDDNDPKTIIVTLLSDAIVQDCNGVHVSSIEPVIGVMHKMAFFHTRVMGGFNRTWNLPIQQTMAIQAGSVFLYDYNAELLILLRKLEISGIGERRQEGFGRIAINWNLDEKINVKKVILNIPDQPESMSAKSEVFAGEILNRMMRVKLNQALLEKVNELSIKSRPHNSQLSRMRGAVYRALSKNDIGEIKKHLDDMKKTAKDQFLNAKIEGKYLDEWIESFTTRSESIWDTLGIDKDKMPSIGKIKPILGADLELEFIVRLIDGVFHKAQKEANNE